MPLKEPDNFIVISLSGLYKAYWRDNSYRTELNFKEIGFRESYFFILLGC